ncbi:hypothetical protein AVEN_82894-1 [Araneus ventricosus]|uniref:Uncharacterized protein n=1 Tax=Araneus ventricosus TaxID=182803 RepID=A0A4Y2JXY5_ARAVE|nr:hypothetical protein AVEN_82894-1 [Araneus ventricosus]
MSSILLNPGEKSGLKIIETVRREAHEPLHPSCTALIPSSNTAPTVQTSGGIVLIWKCFCWARLESATIFSNEMESPDYVRLLSNHLSPSMDCLFPEDNGIFQDDNGRTHRVRSVDNWF